MLHSPDRSISSSQNYLKVLLLPVLGAIQLQHFKFQFGIFTNNGLFPRIFIWSFINLHHSKSHHEGLYSSCFGRFRVDLLLLKISWMSMLMMLLAWPLKAMRSPVSPKVGAATPVVKVTVQPTRIACFGIAVAPSPTGLGQTMIDAASPTDQWNAIIRSGGFKGNKWRGETGDFLMTRVYIRCIYARTTVLAILVIAILSTSSDNLMEMKQVVPKTFVPVGVK